MDILVIGGSGFVGTNFIQYLLEKYKDNNIVNIDKLENSKNNLKDEDSKNYRFYQIDVCNYEELLKLFKFWFGFDIIINFTDSLNGLCNVLEIIKKYKVKKLLQVSTEIDSICESTALSYFSSFSIPVVISRSSELYGPFQKINKFIPSIVTDLILDKFVTAQQKNSKNWLNVFDYCRALDTLIHYGQIGQIYDICGSEIWNEFDVVNAIIETMGRSNNVLEGAREINQELLQINSKIADELSWMPLVKMKEGLEETVEWYKSNTEWWQ